MKPGYFLACFLLSAPITAQMLTGRQEKPGKAVVTPVDKDAVTGRYQLGQFTMQPGEIDQVILFRDPASEQTVMFDLLEGGAIVSFKYRNIEHTWGFNGGGLLQMAFHNHRTDGPWDGDYNPTQAGDGTAMSPVTGIGGNGRDTLIIVTMMLDFNHNNGFYPYPLLAVWNGKVDDHTPASYFSPYVLETTAHWVPNPSGEPKYYLRLDERITHLTDEVIGSFGFDFADYQKWEFSVKAISPDNCPCSPSETNYVAGGWYSDITRQTGLAIAMPSSNFPNSKVGGGFNSDYMWRNHSFHLSSSETLDGVTSKSFVWYVMTGSWDHALQFAKKLGPEGGVK